MGVLGIGEARFHELRAEVLQAALERLEPRPVGRPRQEPSEAEARVATLEAELLDLRIDLKAAQVREEIALAMPHLLERPAEALKKTHPLTHVFDRIDAIDQPGQHAQRDRIE